MYRKCSDENVGGLDRRLNSEPALTLTRFAPAGAGILEESEGDVLCYLIGLTFVRCVLRTE